MLANTILQIVCGVLIVILLMLTATSFFAQRIHKEHYKASFEVLDENKVNWREAVARGRRAS